MRKSALGTGGTAGRCPAAGDAVGEETAVEELHLLEGPVGKGVGVHLPGVKPKQAE